LNEFSKPLLRNLYVNRFENVQLTILPTQRNIKYFVKPSAVANLFGCGASQ